MRREPASHTIDNASFRQARGQYNGGPKKRGRSKESRNVAARQESPSCMDNPVRYFNRDPQPRQRDSHVRPARYCHRNVCSVPR
jgi:hypothetical protein